jgi:hypothetical protein
MFQNYQTIMPNANNSSAANAAYEAANAECSTCDSRTYQDVSNDGGVSFQSPTHISPGQSFSAVMSHEREHQSRESMKAQNNGSDVIMNIVRVFMGTCEECGTVYTAGGETKTVTASRSDSEHNQSEKPSD